MFNKKFSTPQLLLFEILKIIIPNTNISYNNRKIIKPYEIDIYIEKYKLGFEYNGMFWHKYKNSVKNDLIKQTKCIENNISLIIINEKSYNYVSDIKDQLIENLNNINKLTGLSIFPDDINTINENNLFNLIKSSILNESDIIKIINKYNNITDFKKNEYKLYVSLVSKKLLNKYTSHLYRQTTIWTIDKVIETINKYEIFSEFTKYNFNCYQYIIKNNLQYLYKNLKEKRKYERKITNRN